MSYATGTKVDVGRSQDQIKATLRRYGADRFGVYESHREAAVMFSVDGFTVRITVDMPDREAVASTPTGRRRGDDAIDRAHDQAIRERWRALLLCIKAKLEAVETGISTIETEFMPFIVMPDDRTIGQHLLPRLRKAVEAGNLPLLMDRSG